MLSDYTAKKMLHIATILNLLFWLFCIFSILMLVTFAMLHVANCIDSPLSRFSRMCKVALEGLIAVWRRLDHSLGRKPSDYALACWHLLRRKRAGTSTPFTSRGGPRLRVPGSRLNFVLSPLFISTADARKILLDKHLRFSSPPLSFTGRQTPPTRVNTPWSLLTDFHHLVLSHQAKKNVTFCNDKTLQCNGSIILIITSI